MSLVGCLNVTERNWSLAGLSDDLGLVSSEPISGNYGPEAEYWERTLASGKLVLVQANDDARRCSVFVFDAEASTAAEELDHFLTGEGAPFETTEVSRARGIETRHYVWERGAIDLGASMSVPVDQTADGLVLAFTTFLTRVETDG